MVAALRLCIGGGVGDSVGTSLGGCIASVGFSVLWAAHFFTTTSVWGDPAGLMHCSGLLSYFWEHLLHSYGKTRCLCRMHSTSSRECMMLASQCCCSTELSARFAGFEYNISATLLTQVHFSKYGAGVWQGAEQVWALQQRQEGMLRVCSTDGVQLPSTSIQSQFAA
jgi:hypothetical protein